MIVHYPDTISILKTYGLHLIKTTDLKELSMGMTNDYIDALKFNSTFLRIGSKIFGPRS